VKTLQRRYTDLARRCKRAWLRGRLQQLKEALWEQPRAFWKQIRGPRAASVVGDAGTWQHYVRQLFSPNTPACTTMHGTVHEGAPDSNQLSEPFTQEEVRLAAATLKNGKAADLDGVRAEMIKALVDEEAGSLLPHIVHVFNLSLSAGSIPPSWCKGCVHPIPKSASPTTCDDYRCLTLGTILGKLFSTALNHRLNAYLEGNHLRTPFQAGFRTGHSPVDQVFVLNHLIDTAIHKGTPLYCTFVDLRKAFDSVRHEHLWDRMRHYGVGGTFLQCVQSLYQHSLVCVDVNGQLTAFERIRMGVRQGDPLSPTLFGLCIDTLQHDLQQHLSPADTLSIGGLPAHSLLFADDVALIGTTPAAQQRSHDVLARFCKDWDLQVNLLKTKVVVFNPKPSDARLSWTLGSAPVTTADQYAYLGILMHARKGIRLAPAALADSGRRAYFAMVANCQRLGLTDPSVQHHLFQALVLPVFSYGAELWGTFVPLFTANNYYSKAPAEHVHVRFLRWFTGVPLHTHKRILTQLGGRMPLGAHWLLRMANFWNRMVSQPTDRLIHRAFLDNLALWRAGARCWTSRAIPLFETAGIMAPGADNDPATPLSQLKLAPADPIAALNLNSWQLFTIPPRSLPTQQHVKDRTLSTLASWFLQLTVDLTVHTGIPGYHWRTLLRFCGGGHSLEVTHALRHEKARSMCTCKLCGAALEDEMHLLVECPAYEEIRVAMPCFRNLPADTGDAMRHLFQPQNFMHLAKFVSQALSTRDDYITCVPKQ
jgi:Reverse transcriptase (RNA-dependent DNA polymerase)